MLHVRVWRSGVVFVWVSFRNKKGRSTAYRIRRALSWKIDMSTGLCYNWQQPVTYIAASRQFFCLVYGLYRSISIDRRVGPGSIITDKTLIRRLEKHACFHVCYGESCRGSILSGDWDCDTESTLLHSGQAISALSLQKNVKGCGCWLFTSHIDWQHVQ